MSSDGREQKVYYDRDGNRYSLDERGRKITPEKAEVKSRKGGFTEYDSSRGHCGLCGRLTCNGSCFKWR
jgi:hypothetical protein